MGLRHPRGVPSVHPSTFGGISHQSKTDSPRKRLRRRLSVCDFNHPSFHRARGYTFAFNFPRELLFSYEFLRSTVIPF